MDRYELAEFNGLLFILGHWVPVCDRPRMVRYAYPTGIPSAKYQEFIGKRAFWLGNSEYQCEGCDDIFRLERGDYTTPNYSYTLEKDAPAPIWSKKNRDGEWAAL